MKRHPDSSMHLSPQDFMVYSLKHFGETNSFGEIVKEVRAAGWWDKKMDVGGQVLFCWDCQQNRAQGQRGTWLW